MSGQTIWVDADALPRAVREILVRASIRRQVEVVFVANAWAEPPRSKFARNVLVSAGPDMADDHIAEACGDGDLIITNDIPLAARAIEKGATVIRPRGEAIDARNIGERLDVRNFSETLRESGIDTGGPSAFGKVERQRFANALDRWLSLR